MCPAINLKNGKIRRRQRGRFVKFICNPGYMIAGERHSTCVRGHWDPPAPKCVRPTCANKVRTPLNGLIYPSHSGAALHFFCRAGFNLRGPADVFCDGKTWDNNAPICISAGQKPQLSCDFESEDLCGWSHDLNHDFDWRREQYATPSGAIGTGPSFDHTLGVGKPGHYMYIESSSRNENDTARLISPLFDQVDSEVCLEFFYHMYGQTIGTLRVYIKKYSDPWNLDPKSAIFSKSGNQGNRWYRSFHDIGLIDEDFQVIIEGVRGSGYVSDMAVDDIKIITNCSGDLEQTTTTDISVTDVFPTIDTCENRCGSSEELSTSNLHITCDCDVNCYENNRCCPDFFDFCVLATSTESEMTSINEEDTRIQTTMTASKTVVSERPQVDINPVHHTTHTTPRTQTERATFTQAKVTSSVIPTSFTTRVFRNITSFIKTTRKAMITTRKAITTTTAQPIIKKSTLRPNITKKVTWPRIYIKLPSPTPEIVRKYVATTSTRIPKTSKTTKRQPTTTPHSYKESKYNKATEAPSPTTKDKTLFITSFLPDGDDSKEYWSEEMDYNMDVSSIKKLNGSVKLLTEKDYEISSNVIAIVVSSVGIITILGVSSIFLVRHFRYKYFRCRSFFSSGVSQSDVRFISNDEHLDFSVDNDLYGKT